MRFGKGLGPRFAKLLLFLLGKPTCITNPSKPQALQVFLHLFNADEDSSSLKVILHLRQETGSACGHPAKQKSVRLSIVVSHTNDSVVAVPVLPVPHHAFRYIFCSYCMYCSSTVLHKDCKPNWLFGCYGDGGHSLAFILFDSDKSFTPYASKLHLLPEE